MIGLCLLKGLVLWDWIILNIIIYIVYAMNSDGEKTTYRYDTTDGTYQKYSPSSGTSSASDSTVNNGKGIWGKILNFVDWKNWKGEKKIFKSGKRDFWVGVKGGIL